MNNGKNIELSMETHTGRPEDICRKDSPGGNTKKSDRQSCRVPAEQMHKMATIIEHGNVEMDNNLIENKIRPLP